MDDVVDRLEEMRKKLNEYNVQRKRERDRHRRRLRYIDKSRPTR